MMHTITLMTEEEITCVELDLTDAELTALQKVAMALNDRSDELGPPAPWVKIDGHWRW